MAISQQQYALARLASAVAPSRRGGRADVTSTLRDRTPLPQPVELDDGEAKWGKPSTFSWGSNAKDFDEGIKTNTTWKFNDNPEDPLPPEPDPDNPEDDPALEAVTDEWTEVDRKETELRIEGPDGSYVDFMRIDEVKFKVPNMPDGREHFVIMKFKTDDEGVGAPNQGSGGSGASGAVGVGSDGVIRDPDGGGASF